MATVIETGGQSISLLRAANLGLTTLAANWSIVSGSLKLGLNISGMDNVAKKIPDTYAGATIGIICLTVVDNKITQVRIDATITIVESVVGLKFKSPTDIETLNNLITIINFSGPTGALIESVQYDNK